MCPYTLDHNKMLASTMQHSTHNHTPTTGHHHEHHNHTTARVRQPHQGWYRENPTTGVSSGPNSVPSTFCKTWPSCSTQPHPPPTHNRAQPAVQAWNPVKGDPRAFRARKHPTKTVRLLRKEVIQPHLPVRLPCYDFVPIASPTFDNSLPQAG